MEAKVSELCKRVKIIERKGCENSDAGLKTIIDEFEGELCKFKDFYENWVEEYYLNAEKEFETLCGAADALIWMISDYSGVATMNGKFKTLAECSNAYDKEVHTIFSESIIFQREQATRCLEKEFMLQHSPYMSVVVSGFISPHVGIFMRKWTETKLYIARCEVALHERCANRYIAQVNTYRLTFDFNKTVIAAIEFFYNENPAVERVFDVMFEYVSVEPKVRRAAAIAEEAFEHYSGLRGDYIHAKYTNAFDVSVAEAKMKAGFLPADSYAAEELRMNVTTYEGAVKGAEACIVAAQDRLMEAVYFACSAKVGGAENACADA